MAKMEKIYGMHKLVGLQLFIPRPEKDRGI